MIEIRHYLTRRGRDLFEEWLSGLKDAGIQARVAARINRLAAGNFGDCKLLRDGVSELRIDAGPGYRVYYSIVGKACVLLLSGGDKRTQARDIERAIGFLKDYKERTGKP